jgi:MFS family permease
MHPELAFWFAFFVVATSSGGVILGVGAFAAKFKSIKSVERPDGLLTDSDLNTVFNVGFQLLTWMSLLWSTLHDSIGPRAVGVLGMALAVAGNLLIALAVDSRVTNPYLYAIAYGLVGGGGNGAFIACFHFASLFEHQGLRCSVLAAGFNVAGYFYLVLNAEDLELSTYFKCNAVYTAILLAGIARIYPDKPYDHGDTPTFATIPRLASMRANTPLADMRKALQRARPSLKEPRFWGFCLTFSWGALVQQWSSGAIGSQLLFPAANDAYFTWGDPTITNATFLFTPLIGAVIDRFGFRWPALLVLLSVRRSPH